jgi:soluble lytic murein transglycosylase
MTMRIMTTSHLRSALLIATLAIFVAPPLLAKEDPASPELSILPAADIPLYQETFALQVEGNWAQADKRIKKIDNDILMGHVLFQRYMHPTKYKSKYNELRNWMDKYADHPEAYRVYRLAMRRKPAKARAPAVPVPRKYEEPDTGPPPPAPPVSKEQRQINRQNYAVRSKIRSYLKSGKVDQAEKQLWAAEDKGIFTDIAFDTQMSLIAASYYYRGHLEKAEILGTMASTRSVDQLPEAGWVAGLAAWKLGHWAQAADLFSAVQASPESNSWLRSAGAYWASRSLLKAEQPERVSEMLQKASREKRTFYGQLALRQLGERPVFSWDVPPAEAAHVERALSIDGMRRSIALWQIGDAEVADREFQMAHRRLPPGDDRELLPVAFEMDLHGSTAKLSRLIINEHDEAIDGGLYPVPGWAPADGYKLDKAFLYAVMRQESEFSPTAVSYAGASGLMQLMPATAAYIQRDRDLRKKDRRKLFDPAFNMMLGQKYLSYLLDKKVTKGNLMLAVAAYNAGPGNIAKWKQRTGHGDDWLLFMESIPNRQNRNYVERVFANLWIYRIRMGQPAPSLDLIANGQWPSYSSLDQQTALNTSP